MTHVKFRPSLPQFIFPLAFGLPLIAFGIKIYGSNGDPFAYPFFVFAVIAFTPLSLRKTLAFDLSKKEAYSCLSYLGIEFFKTHLLLTDGSEFILTDGSAPGLGNQKSVTINLAISGRLVGQPEQNFEKHHVISHHSKFNKTALLNSVKYFSEQWNLPLKDQRSYK